MWPWEHLAFGYLLYSAYAKTRTNERLEGRSVWLLVVFTQLPDLVDKPLAWTFGFVSDGTAICHSIFFVAPVLLVASILASRWSLTAIVPAITIGWTSHLLGDVLYPFLVGGDSIAFSVLLWPLVKTHQPPEAGFVPKLFELATSFSAYLGTPEGGIYILLELLFVGLTVAVWVRDGIPGVRLLVSPWE